MKKIFCIFLSIILILQIQVVFPTESVPYEWSSLPIGAHGFVTGIVYHPREKDLVYIRTDVGGAYRWDAKENKWIQLCDAFGREDENLYGIDGIAVDPQNPDIVYIAAGKYNYPPCDVLKSTDKGKTWERTGLNKSFNGNGSNRSMGEPIAVDPNNSSIIYCGTIKDGLWKSDDGALTWNFVKGCDVSLDNKNQIRSVVFDSSSALDGMSKTIYVGVTNKGVMRSTDGGESWELLEGTPTMPKRLDVSPTGVLYVASTKGLFKFQDEKWTEISPPDQTGKNHYAVALDPTNENNIVCVGYDSWIMRLPIYYSTDAGKTWVNKTNTTKFTPSLPWQQVDREFGSNVADIKIDPFNPKRIMFSDWGGVFSTDDITEQPIQKWTNPISGIEEVVPRDAITPPDGKYRLLTAIADVDGFPYEDVTQYPERYIRLKRQTTDEPFMMGTSQIDYCEGSPNIVFRVGIDWNSNGKAEISFDNTESWENVLTIPHYYDNSGKELNAIPFGRAAVSAQKNPQTGNPSLIIIPAYKPGDNKNLPKGMNTLPLISTDLGKTWVEAKGFPEGTNIIDDYWDKHTPITSDKVNGSKFYVWYNNNVYVSEDWGLNWTQTAKIAGDPNKSMIRAVPNMEGFVWVSLGDGGLYYSKDSGKSFDKLLTVSSCVTYGFGKASPDSKFPTLFLYGTVDGIEGVYRSIDMGETFERINDDQHKIGCSPNVIIGDNRTFGLVYVGTDGRGYFVGKPKGTVLTSTIGNVKVSTGEIQVNYNGNKIEFVNKPIIKDGNIMVPVREFTNCFGANMQWDSQTNTLNIKRKELSVQLYSRLADGQEKETNISYQLGNGNATANGKDLSLTVAPYLINDYMYVPIDSIVQGFGAKLNYDQNTQICTIEDDALLMSE